LVASFDRKVWTKESVGTIRRAFVRLIASAQRKRLMHAATASAFTISSMPKSERSREERRFSLR